jgi:esterase/lipase
MLVQTLNLWDILENISRIIAFILLIGTFPLWAWILRVRDTLNDVKEIKDKTIPSVRRETHAKIEITKKEAQEFKKSIERRQDEIDKELTAMDKAISKNTIDFTEMLAKINLTLTRLDTTIGVLNDNAKRQEQALEKLVDKIYDDLTEHKRATEREIDRLSERVKNV